MLFLTDQHPLTYNGDMCHVFLENGPVKVDDTALAQVIGRSDPGRQRVGVQLNGVPARNKRDM